MSRKLKILIVDDHAIVREGLVAIMNFQKDFMVVGEAEDGAVAVQKAQELKPDVVLLDLMMPVMGGAEATAEIRRVCPQAHILLLTSFGSSAEIARAFENGAAGAITKTLSKEELIAAIHDVVAGRRVVSQEIEQTLEEFRGAPPLTQRQMEILESLTRGLTNDDIATQFGISKAGVKFHLLTIFRKLGVANRTEAVGLAMRKSLFKN